MLMAKRTSKATVTLSPKPPPSGYISLLCPDALYGRRWNTLRAGGLALESVFSGPEKHQEFTCVYLGVRKWARGVLCVPS